MRKASHLALVFEYYTGRCRAFEAEYLMAPEFHVLWKITQTK